MAGHQLIDDHLDELARRLPAHAVEELTDGLLETWQSHVDVGLTPADAARAAIAEFGDPRQITHAFVAQAPGRGTARKLLATGPVAGACWAAGLLAAHAWTWTVPPLALAVMATALLIVVTLLVTAATSRHSYRLTRLSVAGGLGLVIVDAVMLAVAFGLMPGPVWPMLAAIAASAARIVLTLRALPHTLNRR